MINTLPEVIFWLLWLDVLCCFLAIQKIFVPKRPIYPDLFERVSGLISLIIGIIFLSFLMGWLK